MAYTDLFNEAIDDVTATLTAVSGLRVVNDPTKLAPNCVYLDAPNFTTTFGNGNIVRLEFPIKVIGSGPAGLPVLRSILSIVATRAWLVNYCHGWPSVKPRDWWRVVPVLRP
jgi:hypothetical protein